MIPLAIGFCVLGFAAMRRAFAASAAFETTSRGDSFLAGEAFGVGLRGALPPRAMHGFAVDIVPARDADDDRISL